jgi:hypothetical protein
LRILSLVAIAFTSLSAFCFGQAADQSASGTTWDLFGGASFIHPTDANSQGDLYGWDTSLTERPYSAYPWVGGTIRLNGAYRQSSSPIPNGVAYVRTSTPVYEGTVKTGSSMYTAMAGPSVQFRLRTLEPFAHALFGAVIEKVSIAAVGNPVASSSSHFGYSLGGGFDLPLSARWAVRAQADWINTSESATQHTSKVSVSSGVVLRF